MAAGPQTRRSYEMAALEAPISKLLAALNGEAGGFCQGRVLGSVSVVTKVAAFRGVIVSNNYVTHRVWGLAAEPCPERR